MLPFAYLQAFPVEMLTGTARSRTQALAGLAAQLGWAAVAWVRAAALVAARPAPLRRVRRLMRYLRLFGVQLRASLQVTMQYRADFFVGAVHGRVLRLLERGAAVRPVGAAPDDRRLVARRRRCW